MYQFTPTEISGDLEFEFCFDAEKEAFVNSSGDTIILDDCHMTHYIVYRRFGEEISSLKDYLNANQLHLYISKRFVEVMKYAQRVHEMNNAMDEELGLETRGLFRFWL